MSIPTTPKETTQQRNKRQREKADQLEQDIRDLKEDLRWTEGRRERKRIQDAISFTEKCLGEYCC